MILQALAEAAESRGHTVKAGSDGALLVIAVREDAHGIRIDEESGERWTLRLVLRIDGADTGSSRWCDTAKRRIEHDVAAVLAEIEKRAATSSAKRDARRRTEARVGSV